MAGIKVQKRDSIYRFRVFVVLVLVVSSGIYLVNWRIEKDIDTRVTTKAHSKLIELYGEDYVETYFQFLDVDRHPHRKDRYRSVSYWYSIEIDDQKFFDDVNIRFDREENIVSAYGLCTDTNILPFQVSKDQAIDIAKAVISDDYVEIESYVRFKSKLSEDPLLGKHVWVVNFVFFENTQGEGVGKEVYVDPKNGEILGEMNWARASQ